MPNFLPMKIFSLPSAFLKTGVEWNSLDGPAVRFIFLIGGPDDKQTEYLQILSNLTLAIKDETMRKKMLTAHSPENISIAVSTEIVDG